MGRPTKSAALLKEYRNNETADEKKERLLKNRQRNSLSRSQESPTGRDDRLSRKRNYMRCYLSQETPNNKIRRLNIIQKRLNVESPEQREHRLNVIRDRLNSETPEEREHRLDVIHERLGKETPEERQHRLGVIHERLAKETPEERQHRLGVIHERLAKETPEERQHRLDVIHERLGKETPEERQHRLGVIQARIGNELPDERTQRLTVNRERNAETLRVENQDQRRIRLDNMRETSRRNRFIGEDNFLSAINEFADVPCMVCRKLLYPKQRCSLDTVCRLGLLPSELVEMNKIVTCSRCSTNLRKRKVPSQAYWNKMDVTPIPPELACLSDVEQRLLTRMIPFLKIIKVQNRFSQNWCKGQVVLFAQDVVEIAEQLPLPLTSAGLVIVVESRENLQNQRQFKINIERVKIGLQWLLTHNNLYRDVVPNFENILNYDISQIIQVTDIHEDCGNVPVQTAESQQVLAQQVHENQPSRFININNDVSILRGSFHQGNDRFGIDSRGKQCTAVAAVACAAFALSDANTWTVSDIDYVLMIGDTFYRQCILARANPDAGEVNAEYLALREILPRLLFNGQWLTLDVQNNSSIDGHIDRDQSEEGFPNLENALIRFFRDHHCGILTTNSISVAIASQNISGDMYYWLFDSHARGPKGYKAPSRGTACCMRFVNLNQLFAILRSNLRINKGIEHFLNIYCITPIAIGVEGGEVPHEVASLPSHPDLHDKCPALDDMATPELLVYTCQDSVNTNIPTATPNASTPGNDKYIPQVRVSPPNPTNTSLISIDTDKGEVQEVTSLPSHPDFFDCCSTVDDACTPEPLVYTCSCQNTINISIPSSIPNASTTDSNKYISQVRVSPANTNTKPIGIEEEMPQEAVSLPSHFHDRCPAADNMSPESLVYTCSCKDPINTSIPACTSNGPTTSNDKYIPQVRVTPANPSTISIDIDEGEVPQEVHTRPSHLECYSRPLIIESTVTPESLVYTCSHQDLVNATISAASPDEATTDNDSQTVPQNIDSSQVHTTPPNLKCDLSRACTISAHALESSANNFESRVIFSTSLLYSIDEDIPNIDTIIDVNNENESQDQVRFVDVQRKTAPPINLERETRMEELCWYFLFPDGCNGFGENRDISITALDYFQARIMGNDNRFQRNDYLFFALSVVEYFKAKASVSVSCRMRQGEHTPQGLVDNMHLTMRNIRGSAAYWKRCCAELIAMVRTLGPPTWFVTFSCNDLNWPDMIKALLIADGRSDAIPNAVEDLPFEERLDLIQKYPVVVARQFTLRVNALIRFLKMNPGCLGGPVIDYWYRIEFQNRGSPHLHMLLWCDSVPDFDSPEGLRIIDQVVSCSLHNVDNAEMVKRLQTHKHSTTCYKDRNAGVCRFGFPRPVSTTTNCLESDDALRNNGRFCILKRHADETMVNNYNSVLLKIWGANMDVQPCGSVTAVAYYIAKYASKSEPNDCGDVVREAVQKAKRQSNDVWKQLFAVSMAILGQRLVSAPEAAYRLCHLPLKMCTRKTVFVNSSRPEQRYRLLRFTEDETSVFNNIFDRYQQRPNELEEISLAEFAVRYETVSSTFWNDDDGDIELRDQENENAIYIRLRDNTRMRIRNQPAVLRTRYYTINSDREGFFYNLIVCHIAFRNENELVQEGETAEACFLRRQSEIRPLLHNLSVEQFTHAEQIIQQALVQAVALNTVNEDISNNDRAENNTNIYAEDQVNVYNHDDFIETSDPTAMPDDVFTSGIRSLNVQQKDLLKQVSNAIERDIRSNDNLQPLLLFITGGAGSGKSFLLKLSVEHIRRCYAPTVDIMLNPTFVEVAALTGVAARQISGRTLHSVFSLPIEKGTAMTYRKMSGQPLERERRKWRYIKWLVIDEISMVSYENLRIIHLRLQEFKNNNSLFGGVNVLLFGDIMQLPPVKGHWCFEQPSWSSGEIHLWQQFSFCELTINMRQSSDVEFVDLLNNLRFGEITNSQLQILCERRRIEQVGEFADGAAVRIFPTIRLVDDYNSKMTDQLLQSSRIYTLNAIDESREPATYGKRPPSNVIPADVNNCGGLLHVLKLGIGSRVMLRRNISVTEGLVNGAMGVISKFKWPALRRDQLEAGELPDAVFVKFDDETIGTKMKDGDGFIPIAPVSATYQAIKGYGDVERRMLPLILSWAVTVHKLQGTTLNKAVIDLGKKNFAKGQVYVALSRVKTLDGIVLSDLEPNKLLSRPHDAKSLREMQRLRSL